MATLQQIVESQTHRPVIRAYIKRRLFETGDYEDDWQRIDFYNGRDRVIDWGSFSDEIDNQPSDVMNFEISALQIIFSNFDGLFNVETNPNSFWFPQDSYLNRKFSKFKVDAGYLDPDNNEVGVATVFEGVIDKVLIGDDQRAKITVLPYTSILNRYNIQDLSLTGSKTISQIIELIMNQDKITTYIPYVAPAPSANVTVQDTALLEGTYWEIIKALAQKSASVPSLVGDVWQFKPRTASASVVWDFFGAGVLNQNIYQVLSFDDEGADRVRLYWQAEGTSKTSISSNTVLTRKYLGEPEIINLDELNDTDKQTALDALLTTWENPKPVIEFSTAFLVNELKPFDKITVKIFGSIVGTDYARIGSFLWGDGTKWATLSGSIQIIDGAEWMITRVQKDLDNWRTIIKAEKIT